MLCWQALDVWNERYGENERTFVGDGVDYCVCILEYFRSRNAVRDSKGFLGIEIIYFNSHPVDASAQFFRSKWRREFVLEGTDVRVEIVRVTIDNCDVIGIFGNILDPIGISAAMFKNCPAVFCPSTWPIFDESENGLEAHSRDFRTANLKRFRISSFRPTHNNLQI